MEVSTRKRCQSHIGRTSAEKHCDLCDGTDFEIVCRKDRRGNPLDTAVCKACGLVCHLHIPTEAELAEYYANNYRQDYHRETTPSNRRIMRAWEKAGRIFRKLSPLLAADARVFEVGAGIGCSVKKFALAGFDASGIEPGEGFQQYSREHLRARISGESLYDLEPVAQYDAIILSHVIEHFRSPRKALQHIHKLLKPEGLLFIECPNLAGAFARGHRRFHYAHIHNFTPSTLDMLTRRCGFESCRRFCQTKSVNLCAIYRRTDSTEWTLDPDSCAQTMQALNEHNLLSYYLRKDYFETRLRRLWQYARQWCWGKRYVAGLVRTCQTSPRG